MPRLLHLGERYKAYEGLDPYQALTAMRDELMSEYNNIMNGLGNSHGAVEGAGSAAEARELQDFFRDLKNLSNKGNKGFENISLKSGIQQQALSQILKEAGSIIGATGRGFFTRTGLQSKGWTQGDVLEGELAAISMATQQFGGAKNANLNDVIFGAAKVNVLGHSVSTKGAHTPLRDITGGAIGDMANAIVQETSDKVKQLFDERTSVDDFVTTTVNGKVDVNGHAVELTITATAGSKLMHIATLLHKAYFTAKNYNSLSYIKDAATGITNAIQSRVRSIHFGQTKSKRIYLDLLNTRFPYGVSISIFYYARNTHREDVRLVLQQLRLIYELTGRGQTYVDEIIRNELKKDGIGDLGANYLVYNDPGSANIYVISTAEIISKIYMQVNEMIRKYKGDWITEISKSTLASIANS